ncbi:TPA: hypothetical protein ACH3X3_008304 [Trebouxia sp. C0006]
MSPRERRQSLSCPQNLQRVCLCLFAFTLTSSKVEAGQEYAQLPDERALKSQAFEELASLSPARLPSINNSNAAFPSIISGTFKGSWSLSQPNTSSHVMPVLDQGQGTVAFQLSAASSGQAEVLDVQGGLVMRKGAYRSEHDAFMEVDGVYVTATGQLQAVLKPIDRVKLNLEQQDFDLQTADYRKALRGAALSFEESQASHNLSDPNALQKDCELMLSLTVVTASNPSEAPGALPGALDGEQPQITGALGKLMGSKQGREGSVGDTILNGTLFSSNCGVSLQINATTSHVEVYEAKAVNYTFMVTALTFIQVLLLLRQMESTNTQATASKVSLLMLGQQAVIDAYLCLLHLTTGFVVEPLFNAFATAAFFEFVNFAIFEMQYLLSIWRARRGPALDTWQTQRELAILYIRFYGALLCSIFVTYQSQRFIRPILMLVYSFWIPQIVHCARTDVRQPLRPLYIVGMSLTRLLLPLYLYGCPSNVLMIVPSPAFCVVLVAWLSLQAAVLLCQTVWGPRWFVPKRFLPAKYDYHRPVVPREVAEGALDSSSGPADVETGDAGVECVICMNPADVGQPRARMVTPCNHFFHNHCLQRWMVVKMECPTCRRSLPTP